ncbi:MULTISPECIES: alpha/beta fold hydrolase [Bradyrhizobium]|uniref:alpha/beta fold hydrolase n=1 Tax=Bradyrhizobium TaxID=374 RepID=UPI001EDB7ECE|nr:alpha/beta hydrolase [Bradyrhizobium zhengyangense]MCG2637924.1 alpha/beta hydrolase [Bradyrhizobium zhengyangense]
MSREPTLSRRDMLWAAGALTAGVALARPSRSAATGLAAANAEPSSWVDPAMPEVKHRMIEANGIRLHIAEQGEGPLVILCHGFPECWYSWRHQLGALAKAGFHAVAPDLRGYGHSDRPEEVEKYTILHDIGDVVGLLDALGARQAVIAGHDIGAAIAWQAALLRPDRFSAAIAMSPPFRPRAFGDSAAPPTTLMPRNEDAVFYQLFLQTPEAEAGLGRDLRHTFRSQFYLQSGDRPPSASGGFAAGMVPRKGNVLAEPPALPPWLTEADLDVYVEAYARSGFHGPLAWWRNVDRGWELMSAFNGAMVTVPALYLVGDRDFVAAAFGQDIKRQAAFVPKLRPPIVLRDCGHWTQQERAGEVSAAMIDFLRSL